MVIGFGHRNLADKVVTVCEKDVYRMLPLMWVGQVMS